MKRCSICGGPLTGHQTKACARAECTRAMERETRRRWLLAQKQPLIPTRSLPDDIYSSLHGWEGLAQAIPPAYTAFIGEQLMRLLEAA